jgi:hypothetical protein
MPLRNSLPVIRILAGSAIFEIPIGPDEQATDRPGAEHERRMQRIRCECCRECESHRPGEEPLSSAHIKINIDDAGR